VGRGENLAAKVAAADDKMVDDPVVGAVVAAAQFHDRIPQGAGLDAVKQMAGSVRGFRMRPVEAFVKGAEHLHVAEDEHLNEWSASVDLVAPRQHAQRARGLDELEAREEQGVARRRLADPDGVFAGLHADPRASNNEISGLCASLSMPLVVVGRGRATEAA
jgi:hypothetical protein